MFRKAIPIAAALFIIAFTAAYAEMRVDVSGNIICSKRHIDLTLRVTDDMSGVETVELWYRRQGGEWLKWPEQPRKGAQEGQFIVGFDVPDDGVYEFYSVSIDGVGNTSGTPTEYTQARVVINFDTTSPELEVVFQQDYKTVAPGSSVKFNWFAKDDNLKSVRVRYYWDEAADKPSQQVLIGDSGLYSIPVPAEGVGHLTMQIVAEDYAGFKTTTQTFSYEIKEPEKKSAPIYDERKPEPVTPETKDSTTHEEKETGQRYDRSGDAAGAPTEPMPEKKDTESMMQPEPLKKAPRAEVEEFNPTALQVGIKYNVVQSGSSGLDRVELWYTRVGVEDWKKNWCLYKFSNSSSGTFVFDAPEIGEYGFYIIARNRAGYWSKPRPDTKIEIEPDYTRWIDPYAPFLKITTPRGGEILKGGSEVCVRWVANDDNLLDKPIKIELYSGNRCLLVVENATENDGEHTFLFPYKKGKYWIKVCATDRAGHVTEEGTPEFLIDSGPPTVAIQVMEEEYMQEDIGISNSTPTPASNVPAGVTPGSEPEKSYAPTPVAENLTDDEARKEFKRGAALLSSGRAEEAVECLWRASAHFDTDDKMINEYGIALYQLKRYNDSLQQFRRAVALAPDNSGYLWNVFLANFGLKDADASAKAALDVLRADPNRAEGRSMIDAVVNLYSQSGRDSEANEFLQKIIDTVKLSDSLKTYVQSRMQ